jgi:hypothetical protein
MSVLVGEGASCRSGGDHLSVCRSAAARVGRSDDARNTAVNRRPAPLRRRRRKPAPRRGTIPVIRAGRMTRVTIVAQGSPRHLGRPGTVVLRTLAGAGFRPLPTEEVFPCGAA